MVFIDTSIWIDYFKKKESAVLKPLHILLEQDQVAVPSLVWLEILSGARRAEFQKLKRVFSALPRYFPEKSSWLTVEKWIDQSLDQGQRFGVTDLLIASITVHHKGRLWSLDSGFKRMEKLGFIELFRP